MVCTFRDFLWIVLLPLSWVYSGVVQVVIRIKASNRAFAIPVISVGNLSWGGTGKTPLVLEMVRRFQKYNPAILSRGYKSEVSRRGAQLDRTQPEGPRIFGDEPWMLAQLTGSEVYVGANRSSLFSRFQIPDRHRLAILDDGYQHTQVARNINVLVLSADESPGAGCMIPLGNLREPYSAMKRANVIVITTASENSPWVKEWAALAQQIAPDTPCFPAQRVFEGAIDSDGHTVSKQSHTWGAFCGIGNPQRFQEDLKVWCPPKSFKSFPDHYEYKKKDITGLIQDAQRLGVTGFITTPKDFFKVIAFFKELEFPLFMAHSRYQIPEEFWHRLERGAGLSC